MTTLPILEVTWRDAAKSVGWVSRKAAAEVKPVIVHSIGFLIDRSPDRWVLSSAYVEGGESVGAPEQIPSQLILSARCFANCENLPQSNPEESPLQGSRTPGDRSDTGPGLRDETAGDVPAVSPPQGAL